MHYPIVNDATPHSKLCYEQVRLAEESNNLVGTFSGGMKRRMSVAIALVGDPQVLFLHFCCHRVL